MTIAQSIRKAPKVLNYHDYRPFVEGWGVYAETLGDELGLSHGALPLDLLEGNVRGWVRGQKGEL